MISCFTAEFAVTFSVIMAKASKITRKFFDKGEHSCSFNEVTNLTPSCFLPKKRYLRPGLLV